MYNYKQINLDTSSCKTNEDFRNTLILEFLKEVKGEGNGNLASRYEYIVENIKQHKITLRRPAPLNKGMDFRVTITPRLFNNNGIPSHQNIIDDLLAKKAHDPTTYNNSIKNYIKDLYNSNTLPNISYNIPVGEDISIVLATLKWLFIEQDITYWNYSGRDMLYNGLKELELTF